MTTSIFEAGVRDGMLKTALSKNVKRGLERARSLPGARGQYASTRLDMADPKKLTSKFDMIPASREALKSTQGYQARSTSGALQENFKRLRGFRTRLKAKGAAPQKWRRSDFGPAWETK